MKYLALLVLVLLSACTQRPKKALSLERLDPALDAIVPADATLEVIATGYDWSEGPVWVESQKMLLFSDVPKNTIYKWTEAKGAKIYLTPSGYTDTVPRGGEPGSNGLLIDHRGNLVLCQHGDRRVARMQAPLDHPKSDFITIAGNYNGKRFNSPNDACIDKNNNIYLTDPPYGLVNDSVRETPYQGVYKVSPDGKVTLLLDSITRPNGIALSPDERYLYVANSDGDKAHWYRYELGDSTVVSGDIFYDATPLMSTGAGVPDGMKVDKKGNLFATGPGGICIINPQGKLLGRIRFEGPTSNCALADDDKTLYVTNDDKVIRIRLR